MMYSDQLKRHYLCFALIAWLMSVPAFAQPAAQDTVSIDGSSTVYPISEAVAEEFLSEQPNIRVTVGISGTGGGFKKFLRGDIDINNASRPIKESELKLAEERSIQLIELPVAYDGITVVVNKKNTWTNTLTLAELKRIWQPGSKIDKWHDIHSSWPTRPLHLYAPGSDSGTFDYFTETINGKGGAARADFTASEDDNILVQGIMGDKHALGFFGFAYYQANKDQLKIVAIDNGHGAVIPSFESIHQGRYTPLSRPVFIYVNKRALARSAVRNFVMFYMTHAHTLAKEVGYVPLTNDVYHLAKVRVDNGESGSAYTLDEHKRVPRLTAHTS